MIKIFNVSNARERDFTILSEISAEFGDISSKKLNSEVAKAVEKVRKETRKTHKSSIKS
jgi:hypothetical protein